MTSVCRIPGFQFYLTDLSNLQGDNSFLNFFFYNFVLSAAEIRQNIFLLGSVPEKPKWPQTWRGE